MTRQNLKIINNKHLRRLLMVATILLGAAVYMRAKNRLQVSEGFAGPPDTFTVMVERRDLTISVTESGEVEARYTTDVTCQVEGRAHTIIYLIEEGTILTEEDVKNGTILVELDSSALKEIEITLDMAYNTAKAVYEEALRSYEIQVEQNISDITAAKLREEFALMDLNRYLGSNLARQMLAQNNGEQDWVIPEVDVSILENVDEETKSEALQNLRNFQNSIENTEESLQRADSKFQGTIKLFENNYVTKMERDADEAALNQARRNLESRKTALELFLEYDFNKQAKQIYSNYQEAVRQAKRAEAMAEARRAQAEARRASAAVGLNRNEEYHKWVKKALAACVICAPAAGIVVYSRANTRGRLNNRIELGGQVYYRQKLISIPSTNDMVVRVKIREAWIDKIRPEQVALITLDAYPNQTLTGTVYDVAFLASSQDRRMSRSELKVYETMVSIDGVHTEIRDGMNAEVEIIIDQLKDVICVPVQAIATVGGKKVCYVLKDDDEFEAREVEVGAFNNNFIEIKSGLIEGEKISLIPI